MAQKINPISYRLGVKNAWNSNWCEKSNDYAPILYQDLETKHYTDILFNSVGVVFNKISSKKSNKPLFLYTRNVTSEILDSNKLNVFRRSKKLKEKIINSKLLSSLNNNSILNLHLASKKQSSFLRYNFGLSNFAQISARVFSCYFASQVGLSARMRDKLFKFGLQKGILLTLRRYFKGQNKLSISGIRVSLAGKWSKTRSGRKQKLVVTLGKLNIQTINSFVDYDFQTVATKFGACSLKVLISYNNTKKRF